MTPDHLPGLRGALAHPEVFAGGFGGGPAGLPEPEAFDAWALGYGTGPHARRFVVVLVGGDHDGLVVGASTLGGLDDPDGDVEIGWTGYHPQVWGTAVNPETKLLMFEYAFEHGYPSVRIQADEANRRSRSAIERLGAAFVEVLPEHRVRADGMRVGTARYRVTVARWPEVRAGLAARLAGSPGPVELRPWPEVVDLYGRLAARACQT